MTASAGSFHPIFAAIGLIVGVVLFVHGFHRLRLRRRILGMPTSRIRSVAMGFVEVAGAAVAPPSLVDPIYGQPCAFYRIKVQEYRKRRKSGSWRTIHKDSSDSRPFLVDDGSGRAEVRPAGAELHFKNTLRAQRNLLTRLFSDDAVQEYLGRFSNGMRSVRVEADIIRPGQLVFAVGHATPTREAGPGVSKGEAARAIKESSVLRASLDANGDGAVDAVEWDTGVESVRREMESERGRKEAEEERRDIRPPVAIQKGPRLPFILADSQENLVSRMGWQAAVEILAAPLLVFFCGRYLAIAAGFLRTGLRHTTGADIPDF